MEGLHLAAYLQGVVDGYLAKSTESGLVKTAGDSFYELYTRKKPLLREWSFSKDQRLAYKFTGAKLFDHLLDYKEYSKLMGKKPTIKGFWKFLKDANYGKRSAAITDIIAPFLYGVQLALFPMPLIPIKVLNKKELKGSLESTRITNRSGLGGILKSIKGAGRNRLRRILGRR